ncbi:uncharacterized protein Z518_08585 [Rhinocladiella mackenziei CBS 650.93]|uniref:Ribosomal RNA-processing protein 8 n=1 Tax=Rhinocladiella mackenziei CBS 650.93 TaxID=1442369 RepID=A0A0D2GWN5_9EURO|nr:uncharacterized protein Z518_08585 [Rhinocladiella mackenziei CBS 650.93]KIX02643.1 hypothetical protein Z518_08585 [Rhinocladiella mackenziei CBS 650.93]
MFAVPGWAVSSASVALEKPTQRTQTPSSPRNSTHPSKKRKNTRTHGDQASKVSGNELERLWNLRNESKTNRPTHSIEYKQEQDNGRSRFQKSKASILNTVEEGSTERGGHRRGKTSKDKKGQPISTQSERKWEQVCHGKSSSLAASSKNILENLPATPPATKLTPLQEKMRRKLSSARFRHLNETLYTTSSSAAMELFTASPDLFAEYHAGFSQQIKDAWPQNPVDQYISTIKTRGHQIRSHAKRPGNTDDARFEPLPRRKTGSCTIADLGCGDAPLARGCQSQIKNLKLKFHNFDLHAVNSHVTKADISNLPLRDGEADIAVFCLSLMGTNWVSFVEEAWRILRGDGKGEVWVAEVKSRFGRVKRGPEHVVENSVGKRRKKKPTRGPTLDDQLAEGEHFVEDNETVSGADETDISAFVNVLSRRGLVLREKSVDQSNKMFVSMVFVKSGVPTAGKHQGLKWNGYEYQKIHGGKMRFVNGISNGKGSRGGEHDEPSPEEEAKVLKPCVYKTR